MHVARADGIAGDAPLGHLQRDDLREPHETMFGRHVGRLISGGDQAVGRGNIDYASPTVRLHPG